MSIDLRRKCLVRFCLCSDGGGGQWDQLRAALGNDEEANSDMGAFGGGRAGAARLRADCEKRGPCAAPGGGAAACACRSETAPPLDGTSSQAGSACARHPAGHGHPGGARPGGLRCGTEGISGGGPRQGARGFRRRRETGSLRAVSKQTRTRGFRSCSTRSAMRSNPMGWTPTRAARTRNRHQEQKQNPNRRRLPNRRRSRKSRT